jgi:hypothetical protein
LLSAVITLFSISDLTAASMPLEVASYYWSSQAPVRLLFFFAATFYSYVFKPGGVALAGREFGKGVGKASAGWDDLKNRLVFTWGFVEMLVWFWVSSVVVPLLSFFWASPPAPSEVLGCL